jgi:hypothetical protein
MSRPGPTACGLSLKQTNVVVVGAVTFRRLGASWIAGGRFEVSIGRAMTARAASVGRKQQSLIHAQPC